MNSNNLVCYYYWCQDFASVVERLKIKFKLQLLIFYFKPNLFFFLKARQNQKGVELNSLVVSLLRKNNLKLSCSISAVLYQIFLLFNTFITVCKVRSGCDVTTAQGAGHV